MWRFSVFIKIFSGMRTQWNGLAYDDDDDEYDGDPSK